jgi:hypothetical protein
MNMTAAILFGSYYYDFDNYNKTNSKNKKIFYFFFIFIFCSFSVIYYSLISYTGDDKIKIQKNIIVLNIIFFIIV